ncbi:hypothetical protein DPX16_1220 [Anabarilius grahami]|uniref:Uncharacterized protein n=1 Tax=Anabarilius grahami TaxID=495550 RepID=A0A3N0XVY6_ANAGA|nr:hypothetical protein DPX16_1220 [Anabarilius grahami]
MSESKLFPSDDESLYSQTLSPNPVIPSSSHTSPGAVAESPTPLRGRQPIHSTIHSPRPALTSTRETHTFFLIIVAVIIILLIHGPTIHSCNREMDSAGIKASSDQRGCPFLETRWLTRPIAVSIELPLDTLRGPPAEATPSSRGEYRTPVGCHSFSMFWPVRFYPSDRCEY